MPHSWILTHLSAPGNGPEYRFSDLPKLEDEDEPPPFEEQGRWWKRRLLGTLAEFPVGELPEGLSTGEKIVYAIRNGERAARGPQRAGAAHGVLRRLFQERARERARRREAEAEEEAKAEARREGSHPPTQ